MRLLLPILLLVIVALACVNPNNSGSPKTDMQKIAERPAPPPGQLQDPQGNYEPRVADDLDGLTPAQLLAKRQAVGLG